MPIKLVISFILILTSIWGIKAQRVFMTGDSHVFAKIYPEKVEEILKTQHPEMEFSYWAKNGICFYSFRLNPEYYDSIFAFQPDILIVHLGTNGAYDTNFTRASFKQEVKSFYNNLKDASPDLKVVFVTPFTNKRRKYKKKGPWRINYKNGDVAEEIVTFVENHPDTYVIDNNKEAGMKFLKLRGLIRPDNVHLTESGYNELGEMVGREILQIKELWNDPDPMEVKSK